MPSRRTDNASNPKKLIPKEEASRENHEAKNKKKLVEKNGEPKADSKQLTFSATPKTHSATPSQQNVKKNSTSKEASPHSTNVTDTSERATSNPPAVCVPGANGKPRRSVLNRSSTITNLLKTGNGAISPSGLDNFGNTCFLNAIIQCLRYTIPLSRCVSSARYVADVKKTTVTRGLLFPHFAALFTGLDSEMSLDNRLKVLSKFKQIFCILAPSYIGHSQQDAAEFLVYLLNGLHDETNIVSPSSSVVATEEPDDDEDDDDYDDGDVNSADEEQSKKRLRRQTRLAKRSTVNTWFQNLLSRGNTARQWRKTDEIGELKYTISRGPNCAARVLEASQQAWSKTKEKNDSIVTDWFLGQLQTQMVCCNCNAEAFHHDVFWNLSLPVPTHAGSATGKVGVKAGDRRSLSQTRNSESRGKKKDNSAPVAPIRLQDCLNAFTAVETLAGNEKPTCSQCLVSAPAQLEITVSKLPRILIIQLHRFNARLIGTKRSRRVQFGFHLDMSDYRSGFNHPMPEAPLAEVVKFDGYDPDGISDAHELSPDVNAESSTASAHDSQENVDVSQMIKNKRKISAGNKEKTKMVNRVRTSQSMCQNQNDAMEPETPQSPPDTSTFYSAPSLYGCGDQDDDFPRSRRSKRMGMKFFNFDTLFRKKGSKRSVTDSYPSSSSISDDEKVVMKDPIQTLPTVVEVDTKTIKQSERCSNVEVNGKVDNSGVSEQKQLTNGRLEPRPVDGQQEDETISKHPPTVPNELTDPVQSNSVADDAVEEDCRYRLYAVVNHYGTTKCGHYTAICRTSPLGAEQESWHHFDDTEVLRLTRPEEVITSAAYVLFYEKESNLQQYTNSDTRSPPTSDAK